MAADNDLPLWIAFSGLARLFPLPNLVLFPGLTQALHIFEPRYRQMTADALASDRLLAMALLRPGWEQNYEGKPPLYPNVCLGRIVADQKLKDGRYNLRLQGFVRGRIIHELEEDELYRSARLELIEDCDEPTAESEARLRNLMLERIPPWCVSNKNALEAFHGLLRSKLSMSAVTDVMSYMLPLDLELKHELLGTAEVEKRAEMIVAAMRQHPDAAELDATFPPDFSEN